jgi:hypothetical protein
MVVRRHLNLCDPLNTYDRTDPGTRDEALQSPYPAEKSRGAGAAFNRQLLSKWMAQEVGVKGHSQQATS